MQVSEPMIRQFCKALLNCDLSNDDDYSSSLIISLLVPLRTCGNPCRFTLSSDFDFVITCCILSVYQQQLMTQRYISLLIQLCISSFMLFQLDR